MESVSSPVEHNCTSTYNNSSNCDNKQLLVEPPSSSSFAETISHLLFDRSSKPSLITGSNILASSNIDAKTSKSEQKQNNNNPLSSTENTSSLSEVPKLPTQHQQLPPPKFAAQAWPKQRACRAPLSRKFAHPCNCGSSNQQHHNHHHSNSNTTSTSFTSLNPSLPPAAYMNPLHLYDPLSKKCLPTSRIRDMLLKDCHSHPSNTFPSRISPSHQQAAASPSPCYYDDLVCEPRRFRCVCKPPLHLYYESNLSSFGCVSLGSSSSPDGRTNCKPDYIYNVISKECQKIFDVNDLPPSYATGVSATQFSFVTIVLIWILLLILIVTAKLRKLRTSSLYRNSPSSERRLHHHRSGASYRNQTQPASAWLHPFIAAVNGHQHLSRSALERRRPQSSGMEESGNYNDTDFFLSNGNLRINDLLSNNQYSGSQQSINNPPPKFEEIYPSVYQPDSTQQTNAQSTPPLPSNEDLPSYDEAMKQNTMPFHSN